MDIYDRAIVKFGAERQKQKAIEELSELIRAISRNDRDNIIEEYADMTIVMNQVMRIYRIDYLPEILKKINEKEKKLEGLLEEK